MRAAIVGSGPGLEGARRGCEIDAFDMVVRLHDCGWHVAEDHGLRWDIGVIPGPWRHIDFVAEIGRLANKPGLGWTAYHFGNRRMRIPQDARRIDVQPWNARLCEIAGRDGLRITRGFAMFVCAAAWARPAQMTGFGFDALAAGTVRGYAYHSASGVMTVSEAEVEAAHCMAAERKLIDVLAAVTGTEICFA